MKILVINYFLGIIIHILQGFTLCVSLFQFIYKDANKKTMPTGYTLPPDIPPIKLAKRNTYTSSTVRARLCYILSF